MGCSSSKGTAEKNLASHWKEPLDSRAGTPEVQQPDSSAAASAPLHRSRRESNAQHYLADNFTNDDIKKKLQQKAHIYRVVLTGGPCAGKSTMLSMIQTKFAQRTGIKVYTVPEAATLLVGGGLEWKDMTYEKVIAYQLALLRVQIALEDQLYAIAQANNQTSLIVSDRGCMDGRAYCSPEQFSSILQQGGWELETLRDERYDAVVHMVSAAIGASTFYNFDNPARFENVEEAVVADEKLRQMYIGHPLLRVFDNSTSFDNKLERVMQFIGNLIGHEFPHNTTRRFVLTKPPLESAIDIPFVRARVTITVLNNSTEDEVMQVMKREQDSSCVYFYTCIKRKREEVAPPAVKEPKNQPLEISSGSEPATSGENITNGDETDPENEASMSLGMEGTMRLDEDSAMKSEHRISAREYASLLHQRDPKRVDVVKDNISFVYHSHYCEVATFVAPTWTIGRSTLYVDCEDSKAPIELPSFLVVEHERRSGWGSSFQISSESQATSFRGSHSPNR
jgi:predicted ATPase